MKFCWPPQRLELLFIVVEQLSMCMAVELAEVWLFIFRFKQQSELAVVAGGSGAAECS